MNLFGRIRNSLVWRLIVFMILIQLLIVFVIYRNTLSQYDRYVVEDQASTSLAVENIFTEYYQLQVIDLSVSDDEKIAPSISEDRFFQYSWQHILDNNPSLWFNISSDDLNVAYGDIPLSARDIKLIKKDENLSVEGCYELTGRRGTQPQEYSVVEVFCGQRGYLSWALGGVDPNYELPEEFTQYDTSPFLFNIFKSASLFSLGIFLIIPLGVFLLLRPVQKSADLVEKFSLSSNAVNLPLDRVPTELGAFVKAVNRTFQRVRDSYERENVFRAAMAHELRTPLTILRARIDLLKDSDIRDKLRNDVRAMTDLIDRLLHLSEMTADQSDIGIFDLSEITAQVVDSQQEFAAQNNQAIKLNLADVPTPVQINRDALVLVLTNLITNSIRHGVSKIPGKTPIEITVSNQAEVTVRDFGPGYPKRLLEHMNSSNKVTGKKSKKAHSGIGMMIIQSAARAMHAHVSFANAPLGGAVARLSFTAHPQDIKPPH